MLGGCFGEDEEQTRPPAIAAVCKRVPANAHTPVRAARPVAGDTRLRAVYWGSLSARPCFFRSRRASRAAELRLFAKAPRRPSEKMRAWCAEAPLPPRLQGRVLRLIREKGRGRLGPAGRRTLAGGRECVEVPVVGWPAPRSPSRG